MVWNYNKTVKFLYASYVKKLAILKAEENKHSNLPYDIVCYFPILITSELIF